MKTHLELILDPEMIFIITISGNFNPKLFPSETTLQLKVGAQIMFLKNAPMRQFVNGTIGKVIRLDLDNIRVLVNDKTEDRHIDVEKLEWKIQKYKVDKEDETKIKSETVGTLKQYSLKLV